jgi:arylsulfatase A-like enzyme
MYGGYERLSENRTLVSEVFNAADYRTAGLHSNAYLNPEFGYNRGFDYFFDSMTDPGFTAQVRQWVKNRLDKDGITYKLLASAFDTAERRAGANIGSAYLNADEMTDQAIKWLTQDTNKETFMWVHYMDVHHPYLPPAEHQLAFRDDPISEREAVQLRRKFIEEPEAVTDEEFDDIVDLYDAEIRFTDAQVERLLKTAEEQLDDPIIAFTADHGEEFLDHGGFSHHATFYDEVTHVPLFIDGVGDSGEQDALVGLMDIVPTLVDAAGLDQPDNFYGYPLQQLDDGNWPRESVLGDWSPDGQGKEQCRYAYRDKEWKCIVHGSPTNHDHQELYHLVDDPGERTDVSGKHPEQLAELKNELRSHEEVLRQTKENLGTVEMDDNVQQRLRDLGYKE